MCSISVEPMPSRMSTPNRFLQRVPICSGSASPAETQRRSRREPFSGVQAGIGEHRGVERRHAEEDRRLLAPQHVEAPRPASAARAAARRWRRPTSESVMRIAEPVGEEELAAENTTSSSAMPSTPCAVELRRSPSGSNARAARPSACRSSPTNRARTRPRRRDVSAGAAALAGRRADAPKLGCCAGAPLADDDQRLERAGPPSRLSAALSNGAETNSDRGARVLEDVAVMLGPAAAC